MDPTLVSFAGGLLCGLLAGGAAQFGKLCTFAAIEDVVTSGNWRRANAFILALAIAIAGTAGLVQSGAIDLSDAAYAGTRLDVVGVALGGALFGVGMALVGTCAFGTLVRAGTGDLRAIVTAVFIGLVAFVSTIGVLSPLRLALSELATVDLTRFGGTTVGPMLHAGGFAALAVAAPWLVALAAGYLAVRDGCLVGRPRLLMAAVGLGLAVTLGWLVTGGMVDIYSRFRSESLSFVGPLGRTLMLLVGETITSARFGTGSVVGVVLGSWLVALFNRDIRWEAFDDAYEMRRHLMGALLMGFGGVLTRGCTIGQGLSAGSVLALSSPIAVVGIIVGARLGLAYVIEGTWLPFRGSAR